MGSGGVGQSLVPWDRVLCVACRQLPRSAATGGAPPGNHAIVVRSTPRPRGFRTVRAAGPRLILFLVSPRWAATRRPACSPLGEGVSPLSRCRNCGCRRCRGLPPVERAHGLAAPRGTCTAASTAIYVRGGGGGLGSAWSMEEPHPLTYLYRVARVFPACRRRLVAVVFLLVALVTPWARVPTAATAVADCRGALPAALSILVTRWAWRTLLPQLLASRRPSSPRTGCGRNTGNRGKFKPPCCRRPTYPCAAVRIAVHGLSR